MHVVRQCETHTKTKGSNITSQHEDLLANQKPKEKWRWHIRGKWLNNNNNNGTAQGRVSCVDCL